MKKLMLILMILALPILIYSESISEWWESKTRDERIEILQEYISIKNAELVIEDIEYSCKINNGDIIFKPVYPENRKYYIVTLDGLVFEITLPEYKYKNTINYSSYVTVAVVSCAIGIITGAIVSK